MIRISAPLDELPVAYVSMDLRAVFVDSEYRDRASWLLRAHISVSTWHWRIPLPGDDPGVPISPGDERREFEEHPIRAWDPAMTPAMDDIRIRRGVPTPVTLHADCVPLAGVHTVERPSARPPEAPIEAWIRGGPWDVTTGVGRTDTVREDFGVLGTAQRHPTRACAGAGELVQVVGWSVRSAG